MFCEIMQALSYAKLCISMLSMLNYSCCVHWLSIFSANSHRFRSSKVDSDNEKCHLAASFRWENPLQDIKKRISRYSLISVIDLWRLVSGRISRNAEKSFSEFIKMIYTRNQTFPIRSRTYFKHFRNWDSFSIRSLFLAEINEDISRRSSSPVSLPSPPPRCSWRRSNVSRSFSQIWALHARNPTSRSHATAKAEYLKKRRISKALAFEIRSWGKFILSLPSQSFFFHRYSFWLRFSP